MLKGKKINLVVLQSFVIENVFFSSILNIIE